MRVKSRALLTLCIAVGFLWACSTGISGGNLSALPSAQSPTLVDTQPTPWPTSTRWPYSTVPRPSPAPTPTPGMPVFGWGPTTVPLAEPLVTEEQALKRVLLIDASIAVWDSPWSLDSRKSEPNRITLEAFPSRTAETGGKGGFAPELDADAGAVWRITIRGSVCLRLMDSRVGPTVKYDGVTYVISQRHGGLLSVGSGKPLTATSCP